MLLRSASFTLIITSWAVVLRNHCCRSECRSLFPQKIIWSNTSIAYKYNTSHSILWTVYSMDTFSTSIYFMDGVIESITLKHNCWHTHASFIYASIYLWRFSSGTFISGEIDDSVCSVWPRYLHQTLHKFWMNCSSLMVQVPWEICWQFIVRKYGRWENLIFFRVT